jgi:hypothetical protein
MADMRAHGLRMKVQAWIAARAAAHVGDVEDPAIRAGLRSDLAALIRGARAGARPGDGLTATRLPRSGVVQVTLKHYTSTGLQSSAVASCRHCLVKPSRCQRDIVRRRRGVFEPMGRGDRATATVRRIE